MTSSMCLTVFDFYRAAFYAMRSCLSQIRPSVRLSVFQTRDCDKTK